MLLPPSVVSVDGRLGQYLVTATPKCAARPLDWAAVVHELAPEQVPQLYGIRQARSTSSIRGLARHVEGQGEGNRDNALFWAACRAVESGITELEPLLRAALQVGLPEQQARRTIRSAIDTVGRATPPRPSAHALMSTIGLTPDVRSAS